MRVILKQNWRIYWRVILIVVAYLKLQLDPREYVNSQIKLGNNFLSCNEMVFFILQVLPIPNPTEENDILFLVAGIRWNQVESGNRKELLFGVAYQFGACLFEMQAILKVTNSKQCR